ncbi:MAG: SRPBCC family protein [Gaiella sp.]
MSKSYSVRRTINARPETVWALLTDAASYADWNPSIVSIKGPIALGETIELVSIVNPKRTFKLSVSGFEPPQTMVWSDGMPLGLFKGVRTYRLTPSGDQTEFSMEEVFSGLMAPLITKAIPDMTDSFNQFADGLKAGAEAR